MPIYEEKAPNWQNAAILVVLCFIVLYPIWQIGERELYWDEGQFATMALEMNHFPPLTIAHGELIPSSFPMFPYIASLLHKTGLDMELCLRSLSILSLGILAILVWEAGRRAVGVQAGVVGAAVLISSIIVIEKSIDGYPELMGFIFLFAAWLAWFNIGASSGSWNLAWIVSFIFCGLAFYTIGWAGIIYFLFPMIFMRRPLTIWPKTQKAGFFIGLGILALFILFWGIPRWTQGADLPFRTWEGLFHDEFENYFRQLLTFPFSTAWRYLPWALLAWTPFCVAFHPLDKNPIFSRYLRTIFISLFFLLWLSPFTKSRDLVVLAPSLAVMTGINYWLLVRRYGHYLHKIFNFASVLLLISSIGLLLFVLAPIEWWRDLCPNQELINVVRTYWLPASLKIIISLAVAIFLVTIYKRSLLRVYEHILLLTVGIALIFWALINPFKAQENYKREFAQTLRKRFGSNQFQSNLTLFYKDRDIHGLYNACFYLGCKVKKIHSFEQLPDESVIYMLCTEAPLFAKRQWSLIRPEVKYKGKKLYLWKGESVVISKQ